MNPTLHQQIRASIQNTERRLVQLRNQPVLNQRAIAGEERELQILNTKLRGVHDDIHLIVRSAEKQQTGRHA